MRRADSLEKSPMVGKTEGRRRRGRQRRWLDGITNSMNKCLSKLREMVKNRETWSAAVHEVAKSQTQLRDRTTTRAINFPLGMAFAVSHNFWYAMFWFLSSSMGYIEICWWLLSKCLEMFLLSLPYWFLCMISVLLNKLRFVLWPRL